MRSKKTALLNSVLSLILCISMLLGTTFAWFTDSVTSTGNIIKSGTLDVEMLWNNDNGTEWTDASKGAIFNYKFWEPGYTDVKYLKVQNKGDLAFKYQLRILPDQVDAEALMLAQVIDVYSAIVADGEGKDYAFTAPTRGNMGSLQKMGTLYEMLTAANGADDGILLPVNGSTNVELAPNAESYKGEVTVCLVLKMQEEAGNEYQNKTIGGGEGFKVQLLATQYTYEKDSFGNDYDTEAQLPALGTSGVATGTANVTVDADGKTTEATTITTGNADVKATLPAGVKMADGATSASYTLAPKTTSDSNITTGDGEQMAALDVHVSGVAADNTTPIIVELGKVLPEGMNIGNMTLYHVENGATNEMTQVLSPAELTAHNQFYYDPATGFVTVAMATFSEVALRAKPAVWEGNYDYTWFAPNAGQYTIANADQLAAFGALVGGMAKDEQGNYVYTDDDGHWYTFKEETVKLISDINIGDTESDNGIVFYPIGYWNNTESYEKVSGGSVSSTVYSFEGTFDGNGHKVKNFYQNTWEMFGDYNSGYSGTPNHYKDAMGLFGYVVGGTVKNLTVENFQSDGEFTPTGVIAAYAKNATFENIVLVDCNPRVYNTGNGGIVGIGGNDGDPETDKLTFTNITIDNSNTISALWGSWDVACGGLVGMFRGAGHVYMTNCHVAAQIDVYNDVCGNYQYYWYRYAGMMIGTNKTMITDENGYTVPETSKYHAEGCTVHFGDWNDYYYCELVANSLASYTHDHQFSRLTQIQNVSEIQDANGNWNKTGNFILMNGKTPTDTCYHIVKDADGNFKQHLHTDAGTETVNDETVLKENNQRIYLPFNQLFTGYGWGVKHIPVYNGEDYAFEGITILDREVADSVEKFVGVADGSEYISGTTVTISKLFEEKDGNTVAIDMDNVQVTVSPVGEGSTAGGTYTADKENWKNGSLKFSGAGAAAITITDYYFCKATTITVTIMGAEKFKTKFTGDFLYRVGNKNVVALGTLFAAKDGAEIGEVSVTIEAVGGTGVSAEYIHNATWTNGTIQFNGTGVVKVTITDNNACIPTDLYLEVVDAKNVVSSNFRNDANATSNNVVLLENVSSGGFSVSGDYTFYGNGFKVTCAGDGSYSSKLLTQGYVYVSGGGRLDNVQIICDVYPESYLFTSELKASGTDKYPYARSAVVIGDNSTISRCYIHGARTNIYVKAGNVTIKDTVTHNGSVANIHIDKSSNSYTVTLDNLTTIQEKTTSTYDTSKVVLGMGVIVGDNESLSNPTIKLLGDLKQYNWVCSDDKNVSNSYAQTAIDSALKKADYQHQIGGKTYVNLGIVYLNSLDYAVKDERTSGPAYEDGAITITLQGVSASAKVYSIAAGSGITAGERFNATTDGVLPYVSGGNSLYKPQFALNNTTLGNQYIANTEGCNEYCYVDGKTVKVMFESGSSTALDLESMVSLVKYSGQDLALEITVKDDAGNSVAIANNQLQLSAKGDYTVTYSVTDKLFFDKDGNKLSNAISYSWDVVVSVSLKDVATPNAEITFDASKQKVYNDETKIIGTGDYVQMVQFLDGLCIYDYIGQEKYLRFNGDTDFNKIAKVSMGDAWTSGGQYYHTVTVELVDGGVLYVDVKVSSGQGGSSTYDGSIFVGDLDGDGNKNLVFANNGKTAQVAQTWIMPRYEFKGNNGVSVKVSLNPFGDKTKYVEDVTKPSAKFSTTISATVTYDANGGKCVQTIGYATSAATTVTLPTPTRSGYIFAGWYTAANGGTRVGGAGESYTPSAHITLYAQWGLPCTVTYNANGGSCGTASEKYTGTALTLPTPTRDGYWFIGWYDAAEGGNKIGDAGAKYNPSSETTLYAHWQEKIEYTVTYNANGGSVSPASATYQGTALTLPTPTRAGYKFLGWYTAASGGTKIGDAGDSYTPDANITLYAQWTGFVVAYDANGGFCNTKSQTYDGSPLKLPTPNDRSNYSFNGWYTAASGGTKIGDAGATYTPNADVTLYAQWTSLCFTGDTLVTLADGSQKRIDEVTENDLLLVWDFYKGEYAVVPPAVLINHGKDVYDVITLKFANGASVKVVGMHGFFNADLNDWVYIDKDNVASYLGMNFVCAADATYETTKLVDYSVVQEETTAYSIFTALYYNCFAEGVLSLTPSMFVEGENYYVPFEIGENLTYDAEKMQADIEKYGLYTYEDFAEHVTLEQFVGFNAAYFKVSVGKGLVTYEQLIESIYAFVNP